MEDCRECTHGHEETDERHSTLLFAVAVILFLTGRILPGLFGWPEAVQAIWMAAAAILPFYPVLGEAIEELRDRRMGENLLMVIAVAAAFVIGEWSEGVLVLLLFRLGEWLEDKATDRSREAVAALSAVSPDTAFVTRDGETVPIEAMAVEVGMMILIPPHTRVPVDCRVTDGESEADLSSLTGESLPQAVRAGDELPSGAVNGNGTLTAVCLRVNRESAAARILQMVEESAERRGKSEKFITRFAGIYTPAVTGAALLVAVLPPLLFSQEWTVWIRRALVFLVASCPCALVISIPLAFYAGIAAAARCGVLIKGGCHLETLARVRAIAFDKTGTLTTGELSLTRVEATHPDAALALAAALERHCAHPAAHAIVSAAEKAVGAAAIAAFGMTEIREIPGQGVIGKWDGHTVACGGTRLMTENGWAVPAQGAAYLAVDGAVSATFFMAATPQEGAAAAIKALADAGIRRLVMLTGDRESEAQAVAETVGLREFAADLRPEDKRDRIRGLQEGNTVTAFVGDGVNDAPVLAEADIGIAMGLGSPAAIETADAVLVSGGLSRLPEAIRLSRRVMRIVRENIALALGFKAAVLVLAVFGIAPMWLAVIADMGVTLVSVANVLRLSVTGRR